MREGQRKGANAAEPCVAESSDTAVQRVVNEVLVGLRHGRYRPGQRLIVSDLSEQLGISTVPVREALHILSGREVVELRPQRGFRIRELSPKEILDTLRIWPFIAQLNFELAAQRLATGRHGRQRAEIQAVRTRIQRALETRISIDLFSSIQLLYDLCATINDNAYFSTLRGPLHVELYYRQVADILPGPLWDRYVANITEVLELILAGDSPGVVRSFSRHHRTVLDYLTRELPIRADSTFKPPALTKSARARS